MMFVKGHCINMDNFCLKKINITINYQLLQKERYYQLKPKIKIFFNNQNIKLIPPSLVDIMNFKLQLVHLKQELQTKMLNIYNKKAVHLSQMKKGRVLCRVMGTHLRLCRVFRQLEQGFLIGQGLKFWSWMTSPSIL